MGHKKPEDNDAFVITKKSEDGSGTDDVIVTSEGVHVYHCPGGLTEDELLD